MTKVSIVSDLHLEFGDCELPGGDVMIMAGDVFVTAPLRATANDAQSRSLRKRFKRFTFNELRKYWKVFHVSGNHEHYGNVIEDSPRLLREFFGEIAPNVTHLDNEATRVDGVAFIGSTLWATYGCNTDKHLAIQNGMNDFHRIRTARKLTGIVGKPGEVRRFLVSDAHHLHELAVKFLRKQIAAEKKAGSPCVVITHHAPSYLSASHGGGIADDAYYSNQHRLLKPPVAIWCHGHSHENCRYQVGETLIVSNQRGYADCERRAAEFDATAADFELEDLKKEFAA